MSRRGGAVASSRSTPTCAVARRRDERRGDRPLCETEPTQPAGSIGAPRSSRAIAAHRGSEQPHRGATGDMVAAAAGAELRRAARSSSGARQRVRELVVGQRDDHATPKSSSRLELRTHGALGRVIIRWLCFALSG